jgi:hypothetical protein
MSDYNGWTNWETWQILLWANNDQHLYNLTTEFVEWASPLASFDYKCQRFFYDMFPNGTPDMDGVEDMKAVNWKEIAQHLEEWND